MKNGLVAWLAAAALVATAIPAAAISFAEARHLLSRCEFGGSPQEIEALAALDYEAAVDRLLAGVRLEAATPPPAWVREAPPDMRRMRGMDEEARRAFRKEVQERAVELKGWWYREMLETDSPLTERMTLFWHNHFTSSVKKVRWPGLIYRQNALLRRHALGSFRRLLHETARDPAMVLYLDNQSNRKGRPNENFARELLELFTLGEGHYTEGDIKEAARAFTGWAVDRGTGEFRFRKRQHDDGVKTVLGRTGRLGGEEVLDAVLSRPRVAVFITEKLWREFISDRPDPAEVERLAGVFRDSGLELKPLLRALLLAPAFRAEANRGRLIKSPVELIVGTARLFDLRLKEPRPLVQAGRSLGQDLLDPPNVKGWPGGPYWITSATLLGRRQLLARALRGRDMERETEFDGASRKTLVATLLPIPPVREPGRGGRLPDLVQELVMDPAYQLK